MTVVFDNIKHCAKERGMNLQEVAIKAGLSKNVIYQYGKGVNPSLETLGEIAKVLNTTTENLLKDPSKPAKSTNTVKKQKVDIADDDVIMTFEGKEIPPEDIELMRRLLRGGQKQMDENLRLVLNYAMDHQIGFQCTDVLSPITPCGSNPKRRMILINTNFHDKAQLPYQAAHEVGHVLNQDEGCLYMFSYSKASAEGGANKRAIDILVPMYFADINQDDANVQRFLDAFHIPSKMSDWAFDSIQNFYDK